jgi:hypothetical protein
MEQGLQIAGHRQGFAAADSKQIVVYLHNCGPQKQGRSSSSYQCHVSDHVCLLSMLFRSCVQPTRSAYAHTVSPACTHGTVICLKGYLGRE